MENEIKVGDKAIDSNGKKATIVRICKMHNGTELLIIRYPDGSVYRAYEWDLKIKPRGIWRRLVRLIRSRVMKPKFKIGDKVVDDAGDTATVLNVYERENADNQYMIEYDNDLGTVLVHECELDKVIK